MTRCRFGLRPAAAGVYWFVLSNVLAGGAHGDQSVAPYVPTVEEDVELMLDVAGVGPGDYLIDLGSGDGRIVIAAARRGALAHGVELEAELVSLAAANARDAGVDDRVTFIRGDVFAADIGAATVVALYLFPEANLGLRPKLLAELAPGTRVVSNSFDMGDWPPDAHDRTARSSGGILMWIVPARIDGDWDLGLDDDDAAYAFTVEQTYQHVKLHAVGPGAPLALGDATLRGARIAFTGESAAARYTFAGRVERTAMSGIVHIERAGETRVGTWHARRAVSPPPVR